MLETDISALRNIASTAPAVSNKVRAHECDRLVTDYNRTLIKKGYGFSRREIKRMDMIDVSSVGLTMRDDRNTSNLIEKKMNEYLKSDYWYCFIPCFDKGVIKCEDGKHIYYNIRELDVTEKKMDVFIQEHFVIDSIWQIGISEVVHYDFSRGMPGEVSGESPGLDMGAAFDEDAIIISDVMEYKDVWKMIPYSELKWGKREISVWESMAEFEIKKNQAEMDNGKPEPTSNLALSFTYLTLLSNMYLNENKPKADRAANKATAKRTIVADTDADAKKKLIRNVGPIKMTSEKPPRPPKKETVVHYKTAVWKARGGVRHMKDGRIIPFRESVRHRKCLMEKEQDVPVSVIKFK